MPLPTTRPPARPPRPRWSVPPPRASGGRRTSGAIGRCGISSGRAWSWRQRAAARLIGDLRTAAGDPLSARRYYAEAISEARDLGAEREQGLAALGMGRAAMDLSDVTTARRLAQVAEELLERAGAPPPEIEAARELRGQEKEVS